MLYCGHPASSFQLPSWPTSSSRATTKDVCNYRESNFFVRPSSSHVHGHSTDPHSAHHKSHNILRPSSAADASAPPLHLIYQRPIKRLLVQTTIWPLYSCCSQPSSQPATVPIKLSCQQSCAIISVRLLGPPLLSPNLLLPTLPQTIPLCKFTSQFHCPCSLASSQDHKFR